MHTLLQDLRYSLRQLRKNLGFTLTAVISLALGIGATTAVFSVVYAVVMDPYPYANPDRMAHMRLTLNDLKERGFGLTGAQWQQIRKSPVVEDAFISDDWNLTVTGHDLPEDVNGVYVTSNTFNFMGVPPALGRGIVPSDAIDGQDPQPVVVLGYKFWQRHFNSDPAVLGQDSPACAEELHHRRRGRGAVYVGRRRRLPPAEDHPGPGAWLLCRTSPQARSLARRRQCSPGAAGRRVRQANPGPLSP